MVKIFWRKFVNCVKKFRVIRYLYFLLKLPSEVQHLKDRVESVCSVLERKFASAKEEHIEVIPNPYLVQEQDFYIGFEKIFRGNEQELYRKLSKYMFYIDEVIKEHPSLYGKSFLDVGCGKGEFLDLLVKKKISAIGVEINSSLRQILESKGLRIVFADAINFLRSVENDSLLGISAFHFIEHLCFDDFILFVHLAYCKISFGGIIILESPNPKCAYAFSNFFLDPTHIRPYPYELVKYTLEWYNFKDVKVVFSSPCPLEFRTGNNEADYMDYGIIAYKKPTSSN